MRRLHTLTEALRSELQAIQEQIEAHEARSKRDPSFASDDWQRLSDHRVAARYIVKAIKSLEQALINLAD